ncbi:hypothetical protein D9V86_10560, partial [Bacteroidetes/Chlorobi group bacterium ChocPot_Mid]
MNNNETNGSVPGRIYNREDNKENQLEYPIIGKIKIGEKKLNEQGKEYPSSIDYFRATGSHAEQFHQILGEKPNKLRIVFPSPFPEICCSQRIEGRDSDGNLAAISDGLNHKLWNDKEKAYLPVSDKELEIAKTKGIPVIKGYGQNAKTVYIQVKNWAERLTMRFIVLEIKGLLGVWELSTNGVASSIPNIVSVFDRMADLAGRNMNKVVFDLSVAFAKGQKPGSMSRYPVLSLVPNIGYESAMLLNEYKNSDVVYNRLLTDDTIDRLLLTGEIQNEVQPENIPEQAKMDDSETTNENRIVETKSEQTTKSATKKKDEFTPDTLKNWVKEVADITGDAIPEQMLESLDHALKAVTNYKKSDMNM